MFGVLNQIYFLYKYNLDMFGLVFSFKYNFFTDKLECDPKVDSSNKIFKYLSSFTNKNIFFEGVNKENI